MVRIDLGIPCHMYQGGASDGGLFGSGSTAHESINDMMMKAHSIKIEATAGYSITPYCSVLEWYG